MALLLCLFSLQGTTYAAEVTMYQITALELNQLQTNLTEQKTLLTQAREELIILKLNETQAHKQLTIALNSLEKMQTELNLLKLDLKRAKNSLKTANQSLIEYSQEVKKKQKIIKAQRNIAYVLLGGTLIHFANK